MKPLYECPNPIKEFRLGRIFGVFQWAKEIWEKDVNGIRETYYLSFKKVDMGDDSKALNIIIWRMSLYLTILDKE